MATTENRSKLAKGVTFETIKVCGRSYLYVRQDCTRKYIAKFNTMPCKRVSEVRKYVDIQLAKMGDWSEELTERECRKRYPQVLKLFSDLSASGYFEVWNPAMRAEAGLKPLF